MTAIYFFYGLAFFTLGIALLVYPKEGSRFSLAKTMLFIALFGLSHGANEWVDMFALIAKPSEAPTLQITGFILLPLSFLFLILFGTRSLSRVVELKIPWDALPVVLFLAWVFATATSEHPFLAGNVWARYLLGIPGILLTSYALFRYKPMFEARLPSVVPNLKIAVLAICSYGILSSVIVPEAGFFPASILNETVFMNTIGLPVQAFRAICAIVVCFSTLRILRIFEWENVELHTLSITDELTGLLNRRGFFTLAEQQSRLAKRLEKATLLVSADMDNLKGINDTFGHKEGDRAIVDAANVIKQSFRESDIISRFGGDEFVVFQIDNIDADSDALGVRVQKIIDQHNVKKSRDYVLSISIGSIRNEPNSSASLDELLAKADQLMYRNKKSKRRLLART